MKPFETTEAAALFESIRLFLQWWELNDMGRKPRALIMMEDSFRVLASPENLPPAPVRPYQIWKAQQEKVRAGDLMDAMSRFADAGKKIPLEWVLELQGLVYTIIEGKQ